MPKYGKKYRSAVEGIDQTVKFDLAEAVKMAIQAGPAKFDETVDVAMCLGVDPKYSDQMVRGAVTLPHGLGKTIRVANPPKNLLSLAEVYGVADLLPSA